MTDSPGTPRTDRRTVVEAFAQTLSDIRQQAGQPSFRQMSQTSGCISHATLHEATRGKRLPTWETTAQFLIACGVEPGAWHDEWRRADRLVHRRSGASGGPGTGGATSPVARELPKPSAAKNSWTTDTDGGAEATAPMPVKTRAAHVARRWGSARSVAGTALAAVLLVALGFAAADWTRTAPASVAGMPAAKSSTAKAPVAPTTSPSARLTSASTPERIGSVDCPRSGEPAVRYWGDADRADFALEYRASAKRPLCSTVPAGRKFEVGFTLTNRGTAPVSGLRLHMVRSTGSCFDGESRDAELAVLRPGSAYAMVMKFPAMRPGECSAEFEIRDRSGKRVMGQGSTVPFAVVIA